MINQPTQAVIVYNWIERGNGLMIQPTAFETVVLTPHVINIKTQKVKSSPAGAFEIVLSSKINWLGRLTPGSWLCIFMSPRIISEEEIKNGAQTALKMIGRIDSVQIITSIDQSSGTKTTNYTVSGRDWGQVFDSSVYVDPVADFSGDDQSGTALVAKFKYLSLVTNAMQKKGSGTGSTSEMVSAIIKVWGSSGLQDVLGLGKLGEYANRLVPFSQYRIPVDLMKMMGEKTPSLAEILLGNDNHKFGVLTQKDKYTDVIECIGAIDPQTLIGLNSLWQLMNEVSCSVINELVAELHWSNYKDAQAKPTLYKRIKPFTISGAQRPLSSSFFLLRTTPIHQNVIINFNAGDNWRDSINYVEIMPDLSWMATPVFNEAYQISIPATVKLDNSKLSTASLQRDGFKPILFSTRHVPRIGGEYTIKGVVDWVPSLQEWYFHTHKMINGTVSFVGLDKYIGVGENVLLPSGLLGGGPTIQGEIVKESALLAHVEGVSHEFTVSPDGYRSFMTTVSFIRGVFTDKEGKGLLDPDAYGLDRTTLGVPDGSDFNTAVYGPQK
jgi:hypothetical protein